MASSAFDFGVCGKSERIECAVVELFDLTADVAESYAADPADCSAEILVSHLLGDADCLEKT